MCSNCRSDSDALKDFRLGPMPVGLSTGAVLCAVMQQHSGVGNGTINGEWQRVCRSERPSMIIDMIRSLKLRLMTTIGLRDLHQS